MLFGESTANLPNWSQLWIALQSVNSYYDVIISCAYFTKTNLQLNFYTSMIWSFHLSNTWYDHIVAISLPYHYVDMIISHLAYSRVILQMTYPLLHWDLYTSMIWSLHFFTYVVSYHCHKPAQIMRMLIWSCAILIGGASGATTPHLHFTIDMITSNNCICFQMWFGGLGT